MKWQKWVAFSLITLIIGFIFSINYLSDGFSIWQITSSLPSRPQFSIWPSEEQEKLLQQCLSQPYRYMGKGCQFYVFESKDKQYVLKFLKQKHLRPSTWLKCLPLSGSIKKHVNAKIKRRKKRADRLFASCQLAYNEIREETGLIFMHLNRISILDKRVILIDRLGFWHYIDLDDYEYIVQKRGISLWEKFANVDDEKQFRSCVEQLIECLKKRSEKGIADADFAFVQNIGFCQDSSRAIFIDTGQFYKDSVICSEQGRKQDIKRRLNSLYLWTLENFPSFAPIVQEYIDLAGS